MHTDVTQFEIVSEGYLRDEMGCSFVDQPGQPRRCTFPDGTVITLNMTASGLGFARFIKPDLARTPMRCAEAAAAITSIALPPRLRPAAGTVVVQHCLVSRQLLPALE